MSISALATVFLLYTAALVSHDLATDPGICFHKGYGSYGSSYYYSSYSTPSSNIIFLVVGGGWIPFTLWAVITGTSVGHLISVLKRRASFNAANAFDPPSEGLVREMRRVSSPFWLVHIMALSLMVSQGEKSKPRCPIHIRRGE